MSLPLPNGRPEGAPGNPQAFFCHTCCRPFVDANALRRHRLDSRAHAASVPAPVETPVLKMKSASTRLESTSTSDSMKNVKTISPTSSNVDQRSKALCRRCNTVFTDEHALSNHERSCIHKNNDRTSHASQTAGFGGGKPESTKHSVKRMRGRRGKRKGPESTTMVSTGEGGDGQAKPASTSASTSTSTAAVRALTAISTSSASAEDNKGNIEVVPLTIFPSSASVPVSVGNPESLVQTKRRETLPTPWSCIPHGERETLFHLLETKCHPEQSLANEHYRTRAPTRADIEMTRKCNDCGVMKGHTDAAGSSSSSSICRFHPAKKAFERGILRGRGRAPKKARCVNCHQSGKNTGCITLPNHYFKKSDPKLAQSRLSPAMNPNARQAVVLDCEMVGVLGPNNSEVSEVVRLAAVDFLSGEVLIDTFVEPGANQRVISWRTRVSGVSKSLLDEMEKRGETVKGWKAARNLVFGFVGQRTILIGHSLHHDLAVLGMVHTHVVDSALLTRDAVAGGKEDCARFWALTTLARTFLGLEIQTGEDGHDCLEDAFATREVVLWCLKNPLKLGEWAAGERATMALKKRRT